MTRRKQLNDYLDELEAEIRECEVIIRRAQRRRTIAAAKFHDACYGDAAYRARAALGGLTIIEGNA